MPLDRTNREPTYLDVELLVRDVKARYGRNVTYRLDPDVVKAGGKETYRYWVVAQTWTGRSGTNDTISRGAWFRGGSGHASMSAAMYYSLLDVVMHLDERQATAERQAAF